MTRKKTRITLQRPKNACKKKIVVTKHKTINTQLLTRSNVENKITCGKRSLTKTPIKSPFRSPVYRASPACKKIKILTPRSLFKETNRGPLTEKHEHDTRYTDISTDLLSDTDSASETNDENKKEADKYDINTREYCSEEDKVIAEIIQLVPDVMAELSAHGDLDQSLLTFFRQVKEKKLPLTNISFLLWLEVVHWFEHKTTPT
ncbi:hypothetical protein DPMN_045609 [Dreissena polymorpha]|uniref:Uncharacterized protein n=1 Tax=Dreissena polymorpha TaxID=45954 RepID=A0A9D4D6H0_DREPO|nr:hypothetical protein DPMN_045609 [Dreissena polymorpha]